MDQTAAAVVDDQPSEAPTEVSIADHAAKYGPGVTPAEPAETDEAPEQKAHHSAEQKREKDSGKFVEGKQRHRAKSQQASPEDVPRIRELTGRVNAERDRAERAERELQTLKQQHASPAKIAAAEAKADAAATDDPEPREEDVDTKFGGDYGKFLKEVAAWNGREAYRAERKREQTAAASRQKETADAQLLTTWGGRMKAAESRYEDFTDVALSGAAVPWDDGSPIDEFVMHDDAGPDLLYYLRHESHREELGTILALSPFHQRKALTLLSQRLAPATESMDGRTTAPATRAVKLPSPPPTVVRTEAQRGSDDPPVTGRPLTIAEHEKRYGAKR